MKREGFFSAFSIFLLLSIILLGLSRISFFANTRSPFESLLGRLPGIPKGSPEICPPVELLVGQKMLEGENSALKDQFATVFPKSQNLKPAKIVGAPNFIPGVSKPETLIIDKGEKDGVLAGQAVVFKNNLIGKIVKASSHLSLVNLLTNPGSSFTAKTLETGALGVLKGQGNGAMILDNVLLSENLKVSDLALTYGDLDLAGLGYLPNLVVGKIVSIERKPSALFQKAKLESLIDSSKLSTVFVLKSK